MCALFFVVRAIICSFLVLSGRKEFDVGQIDNAIPQPLVQECHGSLCSEGKGGRTGYFSFFSKVSLFSPVGLASLPSSWVANIGIFFCVGQPTEVWPGLGLVPDFKDLRTYLLVHIAASINLSKEVKDRSSRNTLQSSIIPCRQMLMRISRSRDSNNVGRSHEILSRKCRDLRLSVV